MQVCFSSVLHFIQERVFPLVMRAAKKLAIAMDFAAVSICMSCSFIMGYLESMGVVMNKTVAFSIRPPAPAITVSSCTPFGASVLHALQPLPAYVFEVPGCVCTHCLTSALLVRFLYSLYWFYLYTVSVNIVALLVSSHVPDKDYLNCTTTDC